MVILYNIYHSYFCSINASDFKMTCVSESLNFYWKLYFSRSDQTGSIVVMTLIKVTWLRLSTIFEASFSHLRIIAIQSIIFYLVEPNFIFFFAPKFNIMFCAKVGYNKWGATWRQSPYWVGNTDVPTITNTWGTYSDGILCYIAPRSQYNYSMI